MRYDDPELRERLAGDYVLGTMPARARRRFERLIAEDATLAALVADWAERFAPLDDATRDEVPPARVWRAIERRISADAPLPPRLARGWLGALALWRGIAVGMAAACAALVLYIAAAPGPSVPKIVAVLADSGGEPGWIAIAGPRKGEVSISAIRDFGGDTRHAFELWALAGGAPKPVGLLRPQPAEHLVVSAAVLPSAGGTLAVSQEPPGGSLTGLPTGPVMYQGKVLIALP
jgi:anti-sigma-K factor RskA